MLCFTLPNLQLQPQISIIKTAFFYDQLIVTLLTGASSSESRSFIFWLLEEAINVASVMGSNQTFCLFYCLTPCLVTELFSKSNIYLIYEVN